VIAYGNDSCHVLSLAWKTELQANGMNVAAPLVVGISLRTARRLIQADLRSLSRAE
jgi:hypothetical protein